jgi:predicted DNA-binding transcriptional regulator AlpA
MTHIVVPGPNRLARYLTTQEVAEICRTSAETVRYWRYVGKGPRSFKLGRKVLYEPEAVDAWLAAAQDAAG